MLVDRKECLGTIELPAQRKSNSIETDISQDETLADLFHRLGQTGEICLVASPVKPRLADINRLNLSLLDCEAEYAPADLITLEAELSQEFSRVLARLQR